MRAALHAEWTKLRTVPGTLPLLLGIVVSTVGLSAAVDTCSGAECGADLPRLSLTGVQLGQAVVAIFAVVVMGDEYRTGIATATFTAVPRRQWVLAAKIVLVTVPVAAAAIIAVCGCLILERLRLPSHEMLLRPAAGSALYLILVALLSLGAATALRSSAAAAGTVLALLYAAPVITMAVTDPTWQRHLRQVGPATAGSAVQTTVGSPVIEPWKGMGIVALWSLGALLLGAILLERRDA
jgi:ABC-2 type transport system permease protein